MLTTTLTKDYTDKPHEHQPCPLCSANDDYVLARRGYPGIPVRNVICKGCALVRIDPRMTRTGYEQFYKEDFFEYLNPYSRPAYVETIERTTDDSFETPAERSMLPYMLPYVKQGGHVLDVGSGFGQILYLLAREKQVTYVGIEPDPYSRAIAKEKMGIDLADITIEAFMESTTERFDFIHLDQVFEHLLSPLETLRGLARLLTPEGTIYIGVPGTYNPAVSMERFYELAHTYSYTPATLDLFAKQSGLKVVSVRDPQGPVLEVILARAESSHPQESPERRSVGSNWREVVARLKRKEYVGHVRRLAKQALTRLGGTRLSEVVRSTIDRLIRYRY